MVDDIVFVFTGQGRHEHPTKTATSRRRIHIELGLVARRTHRGLGDGRDSVLVGDNWQTPTTIDGQAGRDALFALPTFATPNGLFKQNFETDISPVGEGDVPRSFARRVEGLFRSVNRAQAALEGVLS